MPQTPESFTHDLDGNLSQDGRWNYGWDLAHEIESGFMGKLIMHEYGQQAGNTLHQPLISRAEENRLVKVESRTGAPAGSRRRLEFAYDGQGRRIWARVTNLDTGAITERKSLYDGWNHLAVINGVQGQNLICCFA